MSTVTIEEHWTYFGCSICYLW